MLLVVGSAHFVLVVHFGAFFYFSPVDGAVVFFHGELGVEDFGGREDEIIGPEVGFIGEEVLE